MKLLLITLLLVVITLSGCSNARFYTFQRDRVDQAQAGNRGYVMGTPPPVVLTGEIPKRTMFGLDIEIPVLPGEKVELPPEGTAGYREVIIEEEARAVYDDTAVMKNFEPREKTPAASEEEQWVK